MEPLKHTDMLNYIKVFSGNFKEVQRVFNELGEFNVCSIIRDKSQIEKTKSIMHSKRSQRVILVHKDELDRALKIINRLSSEFYKLENITGMKFH